MLPPSRVSQPLQGLRDRSHVPQVSPRTVLWIGEIVSLFFFKLLLEQNNLSVDSKVALKEDFWLVLTSIALCGRRLGYAYHAVSIGAGRVYAVFPVPGAERHSSRVRGHRSGVGGHSPRVGGHSSRVRDTALVSEGTALVSEDTALVSKNTALVSENTALVSWFSPCPLLCYVCLVLTVLYTVWRLRSCSSSRSSISCDGTEAYSMQAIIFSSCSGTCVRRPLFCRMCSFPGGLQFLDTLTTCLLLVTTGVWSWTVSYCRVSTVAVLWW